MEGSAARPIEPLPKGLIRLPNGRVVPRRSGWLEPGERMRCPNGHIMDPALMLHEGAATVSCKVRADGFCGCALYVATGTMGLFWADITQDELAEVKRAGIRPTAIARFLHIDFPTRGPD